MIGTLASPAGVEVFVVQMFAVDTALRVTGIGVTTAKNEMCAKKEANHPRNSDTVKPHHPVGLECYCLGAKKNGDNHDSGRYEYVAREHKPAPKPRIAPASAGQSHDSNCKHDE